MSKTLQEAYMEANEAWKSWNEADGVLEDARVACDAATTETDVAACKAEEAGEVYVAAHESRREAYRALKKAEE